METGKFDLSFEHPDFVKCLTVHGHYLITGGRDENIRFFDITVEFVFWFIPLYSWSFSNHSIARTQKEKLVHVLEGHYNEISAVKIKGQLLISSGLDATIRQWSLRETELEKNSFLFSKAKVAAPKPGSKKQAKQMVMTLEEADELEELMME